LTLTGAGALAKRRRLLPWRPKPSALEIELIGRINAIANASSELAKLGELQQQYFRRKTASELIAELFPGISLAQVAGSSNATLEEWLHLATHADFDAGRVVAVAGWLLARTEALLCQLAVA
ncbi:MAG TPA: hypothetical protein VGJ91_03780, partial [Polyangiaceae bacterium]